MRLRGTLTLESKVQTALATPSSATWARFVTDGAVQRWRHRLDRGLHLRPGTCLASNYLSGYVDQNSALDNTPDNFAVVLHNEVKAYSLWDLTARWQQSDRRLTVRAGIKNLLNTARRSPTRPTSSSRAMTPATPTRVACS